MTVTKSPPPHGTYARANGCPGYREPCKCARCYVTFRRARKQYTVNRELGRPGLVDATPVREHLNTLRQTMTWQQVADATGSEYRNLKLVADGRRTQVRRSTRDRVLAVTPEPPASGKYIDALGTRRRIQALRAIGYSTKVIAEAAGSAQARLQLISTGAQPTVRQHLAERIQAVFADLHGTPAPAGCSATVTRKHARAQGWVPPAAWDDIDDPAAVPDWTGHCGTDRGYWMHSLQRLPMCERCKAAHEAWLDEQAHLTVQELNQARFRARAAASHREADLAHDARELLRVSGLDVALAAERLGVTRNHLQQALLRNPEPEPAVEQDEAVAA
ncbi:hypothetical protein O3Q52_17385 [Streptomyces sp. ActVer]|uniref:hypothetical protein n=1 Tax=Streptomyces sp. ActVer TaxID=3014558 RepID=UPI0022B51739|nr:hypothetical protein [Streptomyces sp. ActVer]MCZ4509938.1 hypothetical protein [Streptomyces sp. ActVer]